jgi:putative proteasome-type protease
LSVGLPLDLMVYREGTFQSDQHVCIDEANPYFQMVHSTWGQRLREVFESMDDPQWDVGDGGSTTHPLRVASARYEPMRKISHPGEKIV